MLLFFKSCSDKKQIEFSGSNREYVQFVEVLFKYGVECMSKSLLASNASSSDLFTGAKASANTLTIDDKEIVDNFAYLFTLLEFPVFQDLISGHFSFLFDHILKNYSLSTIPQYFLAVNSVSKVFSSFLIHFLLPKIELIGGSDECMTAVLLRLFKLLFLSVSVYPEENECSLLPHLSTIITDALKFEKTCKNPYNLFILLRSLFRSIGGGRFEGLYKEVQTLLPSLLEELNALMVTYSDNIAFKEIFVELCLTTPVRLSVLLPHLRHLMWPLVCALNSNSDLRSQGMRTLELCIDNLMQDFMEPLMYEVYPDLISSLFSILATSSSDSSALAYSAIRLIGKLGGKSRKYLKLNTPEGKSNFAFDDNSCVTFPARNLALPLKSILKNAFTCNDGVFSFSSGFSRPVFDFVLGLLNSSLQTLMRNFDSSEQTCLSKVSQILSPCFS